MPVSRTVSTSLPGNDRPRRRTGVLPLSFTVIGLLLTGLMAAVPAAAEPDKQDYSTAERELLMSDQLESVKPPTTLQYAFKRAGSLGEAYDDKVELRLKATGSGACCDATGSFLTGARAETMPDVADAKGNPVILYFLEHDIREMNKLTKGSQQYFRKRIRMALYDAAQVRDVKANFQGREVAAREIVITPYVDDPNRNRFAQYVRKQYQFVLSNAVPGGVVAIRTVMVDDKAADMVTEELLLDGAASPARAAPIAQS